MALVVTEQILAILVCTTTQRRNQVRNVITAYLSKDKAGAREFTIQDENNNKYGVGPTLLINAPFLARADADAAWADLAATNPTWLVVGSVAEQFTSTEDPDAGINETLYLHRKHWPSQPEDF